MVRLPNTASNKPIEMKIQPTIVDNLGFLPTMFPIASLLLLTLNSTSILCTEKGEISGQDIEGNHKEDVIDTVVDHWAQQQER